MRKQDLLQLVDVTKTKHNVFILMDINYSGILIYIA